MKYLCFSLLFATVGFIGCNGDNERKQLEKEKFETCLKTLDTNIQGFKDYRRGTGPESACNTGVLLIDMKALRDARVPNSPAASRRENSMRAAGEELLRYAAAKAVSIEDFRSRIKDTVEFLNIHEDTIMIMERTIAEQPEAQ